MLHARKAKGPNQHIQTLTHCIERFHQGGPKDVYFLVNRRDMSEMVQRAGHSVQSLGYPALFSSFMQQVSLGRNDKKDGLGLTFSYIPFNEETLERLRGREGAVYKLYDLDEEQHMHRPYIEALDTAIVTMNTRAGAQQ